MPVEIMDLNKEIARRRQSNSVGKSNEMMELNMNALALMGQIYDALNTECTLKEHWLKNDDEEAKTFCNKLAEQYHNLNQKAIVSVVKNAAFYENFDPNFVVREMEKNPNCLIDRLKKEMEIEEKRRKEREKEEKIQREKRRIQYFFEDTLEKVEKLNWNINPDYHKYLKEELDKLDYNLVNEFLEKKKDEPKYERLFQYINHY